MRQLKEKLRRTVKYWRIGFLQASARDRVSIGMFAALITVYAWWAFLALGIL